MSEELKESPVSYRVNVARLPRGGAPVWLEADEEQRAALAQAHGLLQLPHFRFDVVVEPWKRGGVRARGKVSAAVVQACIVSLEPVPAEIEEEFEAVLIPESSRLARQDRAPSGELVLDAEGPDMPETFSGDHVDVGALAEEFFELALDPYPRAPGAALPGDAAPEGQGNADSPFRDKLAILAGKK